jgi:CHAD domain-containing protein
VSSTIEREVKLEPGPNFQGLQLPGRGLPPRELVSTYVDTDDLRLAQGSITLRRREQDDEPVWQLKLPAGDNRRELEWPAPDPAVPQHIARLLMGHTRGEPMAPVATMRTRRSGIVVREDGVDVAELVEDEVDVLDEGAVVSHFDEIEIELREGDESALHRLEEQLRGAGAVDADGRPKLYRSIGFDPPDDIASPYSGSRATLHRALREQYRELLANDPVTRLGDDPDALHDQRVAIRRLRAYLWAGRPLLDRGWADGLRDALKPAGRALSQVRDIDVMIARAESQVPRLRRRHRAAGEHLVAELRDLRHAEQERLVAALCEPWYLGLLNRLGQAVESPRFSDGGSLARSEKRARRRAAKKHRRMDDPPRDAELHDVRRAVKRARYAAELTSLEGTRRSGKRIKRAKTIQDVLGEHQDAVVMIDMLGRLADGDTGPAAVRLATLEERRRLVSRAAFPAAWRKFA